MLHANLCEHQQSQHIPKSRVKLSMEMFAWICFPHIIVIHQIVFHKLYMWDIKHWYNIKNIFEICNVCMSESTAPFFISVFGVSAAVFKEIIASLSPTFVSSLLHTMCLTEKISILQMSFSSSSAGNSCGWSKSVGLNLNGSWMGIY